MAVLKTAAETRAGSNPAARTIRKVMKMDLYYIFLDAAVIALAVCSIILGWNLHILKQRYRTIVDRERESYNRARKKAKHARMKETLGGKRR